MLIVGAGGHARELLEIVESVCDSKGIFFFDDTDSVTGFIYNKYKIIRSLEEAKEIFKSDNSFCIGVGNPELRWSLAKKIKEIGGELHSAISLSSSIGSYNVNLAKGLNIMQGAVITNDVSIDEGTLIHINCSIHHDVSIGKYCEISPGARLLGKSKIGDFCSIGTNAVILPKVIIGNNVIVGAGAVVTRSIGDNVIAVGIPAKQKRK